MALPNPLRTLSRAARRRTPPPALELRRQSDDRPKRGLFTEPVRITSLTVTAPEPVDGGRQRVVFQLEVRDAEDRRCPDLAVEAVVTGPQRTTTVSGHTDLFGRMRVTVDSVPGTCHLRVSDVAAFGLDWDATAGPSELEVDVP